jgi:hypothetical protein
MGGGSVSELVAEVSAVVAGPDDLCRARSALGALRRLRGWCDAQDVALTAMVARCTPAPEGHVKQAGGLSDREAEQRTERARTAGELAPLGEALAGGEIRGEHVDVVARVRGRLDPGERERFDRAAGELAGMARRSDPAVFARYVARQAQRARVRDGEDELVRQRRAARCRTYVSRESGMWVLHLEVDPARGWSWTGGCARRWRGCSVMGAGDLPGGSVGEAGPSAGVGGVVDAAGGDGRYAQRRAARGGRRGGHPLRRPPRRGRCGRGGHRRAPGCIGRGRRPPPPGRPRRPGESLHAGARPAGGRLGPPGRAATVGAHRPVPEGHHHHGRALPRRRSPCTGPARPRAHHPAGQPGAAAGAACAVPELRHPRLPGPLRPLQDPPRGLVATRRADRPPQPAPDLREAPHRRARPRLDAPPPARPHPHRHPTRRHPDDHRPTHRRAA